MTESESIRESTGLGLSIITLVAFFIVACIAASQYEKLQTDSKHRYNSLEREYQSLKKELAKRPTLADMLGSPQHRKTIQAELSTGKWIIPAEASKKGLRGEKGPRGEKGTRGNPGGPVGATGAQGSRGRMGERGTQGTQGPKGDLGGPVGPQGEKGANGAQGQRGMMGGRGFIGPQGPIGNKGKRGEDGTLPITELCIALAVTLAAMYFAKSLIDFYLTKFRHRHGGIKFEYTRKT